MQKYHIAELLNDLSLFRTIYKPLELMIQCSPCHLRFLINGLIVRLKCVLHITQMQKYNIAQLLNDLSLFRTIYKRLELMIQCLLCHPVVW